MAGGRTFGWWVGAAVVSGCAVASEEEPLSQEAQIAQYEDLAAELDAGRTLLVEGPAQDYAAAGAGCSGSTPGPAIRC